jgi:hypothetical protein
MDAAKIEDELRKVANLSRPYTYDYDAERIAELRIRLLGALDATFAKFDDGLARNARSNGRSGLGASVVDDAGDAHEPDETPHAAHSPEPGLAEEFIAIGNEFGSDWVKHASRAQILGALRTRPGVPTSVDRELLQFAVIASGKNELDEMDRKAVRKGFWDGVSPRRDASSGGEPLVA